jgi:hypothetical protein
MCKHQMFCKRVTCVSDSRSAVRFAESLLSIQISLNNPQQPDFLLSLADDTDIVPWIDNLLQHEDHNITDIASLDKQLNHIVPALEVASEDLSLHIVSSAASLRARVPWFVTVIRLNHSFMTQTSYHA